MQDSKFFHREPQFCPISAIQNIRYQADHSKYTTWFFSMLKHSLGIMEQFYQWLYVRKSLSFCLERSISHVQNSIFLGFISLLLNFVTNLLPIMLPPLRLRTLLVFRDVFIFDVKLTYLTRITQLTTSLTTV